GRGRGDADAVCEPGGLYVALDVGGLPLELLGGHPELLDERGNDGAHDDRSEGEQTDPQDGKDTAFEPDVHQKQDPAHDGHDDQRREELALYIFQEGEPKHIEGGVAMEYRVQVRGAKVTPPADRQRMNVCHWAEAATPTKRAMMAAKAGMTYLA